MLLLFQISNSKHYPLMELVTMKDGVTHTSSSFISCSHHCLPYRTNFFSLFLWKVCSNPKKRGYPTLLWREHQINYTVSVVIKRACQESILFLSHLKGQNKLLRKMAVIYCLGLLLFEKFQQATRTKRLQKKSFTILLKHLRKEQMRCQQ